MAWRVVGNAIPLSESGASLTDLWETTFGGTGARPSIDPVAGVWLTSTTTFINEVEVVEMLAVWLGRPDLALVRIELGDRIFDWFEGHGSGWTEDWEVRTFDVQPSAIVRSTSSQPTYATTTQGVLVGWEGAARPTTTPDVPLYTPTTLTVLSQMDLLRTDLVATGRLPDGDTAWKVDWALDWTPPVASHQLPLQASSVPRVCMTSSPWEYVRIESYAADGTPVTPSTPASLSFWVMYKDPSVARVPGSKGFERSWVMTACRIRVQVGTINDQGEEVSELNVFKFAGPEYSLSDIVLFVSNNIDFIHDEVAALSVRGPFLLVDSLNAVEEDQAFRLTLNVPTVVFTKQQFTADYEMFVYYVVERSYGTKATASTPLPYDGPTMTDWLAKLDAWAGGDFEKNGRGIAVKRITWSTFETEVLDSTTADPGDQSKWTGADAITGDLLGLIRVWIPDGSIGLGHRVQSFEYEFDDSASGGGITPIKVDPAAIYSLMGGLKLFFATFPPNGTTGTAGASMITAANGYGVWVAAAIADGRVLRDVPNGTWERTTYGQDFVLRRPDDAGVWPDRIADSDVNADDPRHYIDPDPVQLPNGNWMVLVGCVRWIEVDLGGTLGIVWRDFEADPLTKILGKLEDMAWLWDEAFDPYSVRL